MFGASPKEMSSKGAPRSEEFDDIYFSAENGLAETEYVFLDGNSMPRAWRDKERFVIGETGFGTGLSFLAAWKRFEETATPDQRLDFISFEKYPLDGGEIKLHLQPWAELFEGYLSRLVECYPILVPGFHRIVLNERVTLTLISDDVNDAISRVDASVDAWFLDGFKPSTNPDMWSDTVFENVARLSRKGTTCATFTAAGQVRRGLELVGFQIQKVPGYGTKRDMTIGRFAGDGG